MAVQLGSGLAKDACCAPFECLGDVVVAVPFVGLYSLKELTRLDPARIEAKVGEMPGVGRTNQVASGSFQQVTQMYHLTIPSSAVRNQRWYRGISLNIRQPISPSNSRR